MSREPSDEEMAEMAAITVAFGKLDADGDGVITRAELKAAMAERGFTPSDEAVDLELRRVDLNADGRITLREWLHMWSLALTSSA